MTRGATFTRTRPRRRAPRVLRSPATVPPGLGACRIEAGADETPALVAQSAALLPAELLQGGEIIILLLKPSAWFILLGSLKFLALLGLLLAAAMTASSWAWIGLGTRDLVLLAVAIGGARLFWQFLEWLGRLYVLTDRRVIRVGGVARVQIFEAPLKEVLQAVTLFSMRERLFGLGTIGFTTSSDTAAPAQWRMLARPLEVHQEVQRALTRYR